MLDTPTWRDQVRSQEEGQDRAHHKAIANEHLRDVNPELGCAESVAQGVPVVEDIRLGQKIASSRHEGIEEYVQVESHMLEAG